MFAIASQRRWNTHLAARLTAATGTAFTEIRAVDELSLVNLTRLGVTRVFLPHWSHIIPRDVFEGVECIVFHMTDLPFGRGGSPLQNLIVRGITDTQVSALRCVADLDAGPVYLKRPLSLHGSAEEIFLRADRIIETMITDIIRDDPQPVAQHGEVVTFRRRRPDDGDWSACATMEQVFDRIRMLDADGYPSAFVDVGEFRLLFSRASLRSDAVLADVRIVPRPTSTA